MAATPKVTWGAAFGNTWTFPSPVDDPRPVTIPRGSAGESQSGARTFWQTRTDEELEVTARFVPKANVSSVTGYATGDSSGADGVRAALSWMQGSTAGSTAQNTFRYYPDKTSGSYHTCYLVEPPTVEREPGGSHYRIRLRMRDTGGNAFTEY